MHKHADVHTHVHMSLPDLSMVPTHIPPHQGPGVTLHAPPRCSAASLPRTQLPWQCLGRPAEDNAEHPPLPVHPWPKQKHALFCTTGAPHTSLTWLFHVRLWPAAIRLHGWECISENSGWVEDGWFCFPEMLLRYYLTTLGKKSKRQKKKKKASHASGMVKVFLNPLYNCSPSLRRIKDRPNHLKMCLETQPISSVS